MVMVNHMVAMAILTMVIVKVLIFGGPVVMAEASLLMDNLLQWTDRINRDLSIIQSLSLNSISPVGALYNLAVSSNRKSRYVVALVAVVVLNSYHQVSKRDFRIKSLLLRIIRPVLNLVRIDTTIITKRLMLAAVRREEPPLTRMI